MGYVSVQIWELILCQNKEFNTSLCSLFYGDRLLNQRFIYKLIQIKCHEITSTLTMSGLSYYSHTEHKSWFCEAREQPSPGTFYLIKQIRIPTTYFLLVILILRNTNKSEKSKRSIVLNIFLEGKKVILSMDGLVTVKFLIVRCWGKDGIVFKCTKHNKCLFQ